MRPFAYGKRHLPIAAVIVVTVALGIGAATGVYAVVELADYRSDNTVFEGLAPFTNWTANLTGTGEAERLEGVRVAPEFFDVLGVSPRLGRTFITADARSQVAVLTDPLWRRRFGADPSIVGQVVSLNGAGHTVAGVLPPGVHWAA